MNIKDPKSSVRDEQFDRNAENTNVENSQAEPHDSKPLPEEKNGDSPVVKQDKEK